MALYGAFGNALAHAAHSPIALDGAAARPSPPPPVERLARRPGLEPALPRPGRPSDAARGPVSSPRRSAATPFRTAGPRRHRRDGRSVQLAARLAGTTSAAPVRGRRRAARRGRRRRRKSASPSRCRRGLESGRGRARPREKGASSWNASLVIAGGVVVVVPRAHIGHHHDVPAERRRGRDPAREPRAQPPDLPRPVQGAHRPGRHPDAAHPGAGHQRRHRDHRPDRRRRRQRALRRRSRSPSGPRPSSASARTRRW